VSGRVLFVLPAYGDSLSLARLKIKRPGLNKTDPLPRGYNSPRDLSLAYKKLTNEGAINNYRNKLLIETFIKLYSRSLWQLPKRGF
jgi:hypothetical protein